ncbi:MAG: phosphotransferase [Planctomycetota bacterium]|nr:phosphotransferase [Planctomycetota bacterium]
MVLKHRPWRTTEVENGPVPVFVKRFHDQRFPGAAVGRWRDRRRARREARRLAELAGAGIRVPTVLGIAETDAGVELRLEYLARARPLEELVDAATPALARTLGALLARVHATGFAIGDLHFGNVLVDPAGDAWLVDGAAVRRGSTAARARDLVQAAAAARERTSARFRARFLLAYLRGSASGRRSEAASLAEAIEGAGRIARRERVRAESDRWLRESGVCARHVDGDLVLLAPRSIPRDAAVALGRQVVAGQGGTSLQVLRGRRARAAWRELSRLGEHGVVALRPLVLLEAPVELAVFERPANGRAPARGSAADCRAVGHLAGTLWDRGLALRQVDLLIDAQGRACLSPASGLEDAGTFSRTSRAWDGIGGAVSWSSSADFVAAFLAAQRGSRAQHAALRALFEARKGSRGAADPG